MIDLAIIRERYEVMSDAELLALAKTEGHELMPEAFKILKEECSKRRLDLEMVDSFIAENKKISREKSSQRLEDNYNGELQVLIRVAMDEKESGSSDRQIYNNLLEKGLIPEEAAQIVSSLEESAKLLLDAADKHLTRDVLLAGGGLVIDVFSFIEAGTGNAFYIVSFFLVAVIASFVKSLTEKKKYKRILANIEASKSNPPFLA